MTRFESVREQTFENDSEEHPTIVEVENPNYFGYDRSENGLNKDFIYSAEQKAKLKVLLKADSVC